MGDEWTRVTREIDALECEFAQEIQNIVVRFHHRLSDLKSMVHDASLAFRGGIRQWGPAEGTSYSKPSGTDMFLSSSLPPGYSTASNSLSHLPPPIESMSPATAAYIAAAGYPLRLPPRGSSVPAIPTPPSSAPSDSPPHLSPSPASPARTPQRQPPLALSVNEQAKQREPHPTPLGGLPPSSPVGGGRASPFEVKPGQLSASAQLRRLLWTSFDESWEWVGLLSVPGVSLSGPDAVYSTAGGAVKTCNGAACGVLLMFDEPEGNNLSSAKRDALVEELMIAAAAGVDPERNLTTQSGRAIHLTHLAFLRFYKDPDWKDLDLTYCDLVTEVISKAQAQLTALRPGAPPTVTVEFVFYPAAHRAIERKALEGGWEMSVGVHHA